MLKKAVSASRPLFFVGDPNRNNSQKNEIVFMPAMTHCKMRANRDRAMVSASAFAGLVTKVEID